MKISVRLIKSIMAEGTNCDKGKIHCINVVKLGRKFLGEKGGRNLTLHVCMCVILYVSGKFLFCGFFCPLLILRN